MGSHNQANNLERFSLIAPAGFGLVHLAAMIAQEKIVSFIFH